MIRFIRHPLRECAVRHNDKYDRSRPADQCGWFGVVFPVLLGAAYSSGALLRMDLEHFLFDHRARWLLFPAWLFIEAGVGVSGAARPPYVWGASRWP